MLTNISKNLYANHAVALIMYTKKLHLLMQLRDEIKNIWYPGHWGLFGGALEKKETFNEALSREIKEEISLDKKNFEFFSCVKLDFSSIGKSKNVLRKYYLLEISNKDLEKIILKEGKSWKTLSYTEFNKLNKVVPYDKLAIDLFFAKFLDL